MESLPTTLSLGELNAAALEHFIYKPVDKEMIRFLANAAVNVIQCDPTMMPPPTTETTRSRYPSPARTPSPKAVRSTDGALPTLEEFITQLVISSNVQVPTLMSTLVYLNRLKSRLQPTSKGLRCTTHRIFLASLILAAKYLNDSSPKNKHWANYSVIQTQAYNFGFNRTEVNLMEKQLLFLLDWELRITEDDLYRELDYFLSPIRRDIQERYARRARRQAERKAQEEYERKLHTEALARQREREEEAAMWLGQSQTASRGVPAENNAYATPPSSRGSSRSRYATHSRTSSRDVSPPGLYSSGSSYAGSTTSRATTPLGEEDIGTAEPQPYIYDPQSYSRHAGDLCHSPMEVVPDVPEKDAIYGHGRKASSHARKTQMLPYEISADDLRSLEDGGRKKMRGVWGRVVAGVTAVGAMRG